MKNAIVFLAWGDRYIGEVESCIRSSAVVRAYDRILITDEATRVDESRDDFTNVIRASFERDGHLRKTELIDFLPNTHDNYLFLDSDTTVIEDISLGFEKAQQFDIALAPAPHYSLDDFHGFERIMIKEKIDCKGQLLHNSGVIFFKNSAKARAILECWKKLALRYEKECPNDQPLLALAMEILGFNPYTLTISYNYRGRGNAISGPVRIWHHRRDVPADINEHHDAWPPRRAWPSGVVYRRLKRNLFHNSLRDKIARAMKRTR